MKKKHSFGFPSFCVMFETAQFSNKALTSQFLEFCLICLLNLVSVKGIIHDKIKNTYFSHSPEVVNCAFKAMFCFFYRNLTFYLFVAHLHHSVSSSSVSR